MTLHDISDNIEYIRIINENMTVNKRVGSLNLSFMRNEYE